MKKGLIIAGAVLLGGGVLGFAARIAYFIFLLSQPADSIGIIGGADGPTAIFLTSRIGFMPVVGIFGLLCIFCALIGAGLLTAALIMHLTKNEPTDNAGSHSQDK